MITRRIFAVSSIMFGLGGGAAQAVRQDLPKCNPMNSRRHLQSMDVDVPIGNEHELLLRLEVEGHYALHEQYGPNRVHVVLRVAAAATGLYRQRPVHSHRVFRNHPRSLSIRIGRQTYTLSIPDDWNVRENYLNSESHRWDRNRNPFVSQGWPTGTYITIRELEAWTITANLPAQAVSALASGSRLEALTLRLLPNVTWSADTNTLGSLTTAMTRSITASSAAHADFRAGRCSAPSEDCFLTSAACENLGLEDQCWELRMLRRFRDGWLKLQPGGEDQIAAYYALSTPVLAALDRHPQRRRLLAGAYLTTILPCAALHRLGLNAAVHGLYTRLLARMTKLAAHQF